jgi:hypothetical protein
VSAAIGAGIGIFGILVSLAIAYASRRPKRIDYQVTTNRRVLIPTHYEQTGKLSVYFEQTRLTDPTLLVFRVANTGKVEIRPDDFDRNPIAFSVDKTAQS